MTWRWMPSWRRLASECILDGCWRVQARMRRRCKNEADVFMLGAVKCKRRAAEMVRVGEHRAEPRGKCFVFDKVATFVSETGSSREAKLGASPRLLQTAWALVAPQEPRIDARYARNRTERRRS